MKKNIITIGGGNGTSCMVRALKSYTDTYNITAVVAMSDSGGSSGKLREEFGVLPPGDILRACLAMSPYEYYTLKNIFNKNRISHGSLAGHSLGNLFLTYAYKQTGNYLEGINALLETVEAVGNVYPVTLESSDLCAQYTDGDMVMGEHEIDRPKKKNDATIDRVWLQPTPMIYDASKEAIKNADYIILGPGSLYCSIVAGLLVEGVQDTIRESNAKLIFFAGNAYEANGEHGPKTAKEAVDAIEKYLPRPVDVVMYNNHALTDAEQKYYTERNWALLPNDMENDSRMYLQDFEKSGGGLCCKKVGNELKKIIG